MPETGCAWHIGARAEQQDRVAVLTVGAEHLLVLADGAGGHGGGAAAAETVLCAACDSLPRGPATSPQELLGEVAASSHVEINALAGAEPPRTTCVLLYVDEFVGTWAHVGDSRLYRFQDGTLVERTRDHSVVELLRDQGKITESEMKNHPDQNRLTDALGGPAPPELAYDGKRTLPADGFILASDGLWSNVRDGELEAAINAPRLSRALDALVAKALARGGRNCDNISIAAIRHRRPNPVRRLSNRFRRALRHVPLIGSAE